MNQIHGGNCNQSKTILDFSANINPLGLPENVKKTIIENASEVEKYPDPYCTSLRKKLAEHEHTNEENIVCGNGADDLIYRIIHALKPKNALICAPTFTEYSRALKEADCQIYEHILTEKKDFTVSESLVEHLNESFDICFICTPNNPTGRLIPPELLNKIARKCDEYGTFLVCDECFLDFVNEGESYSLCNFMTEKCIILKAFTKLYAMPGLRLGYIICGSSKSAKRIQESGQFWSVSSLAQCAGIAALEENEYVRKSKSLIADERRFLTKEISALGVKVFDSAANFLLFKSDIGLAEKMLAEGILIRDCENFSGLTSGFYRIAVKTHEENMQLVNALVRCING